MSAATAPTVEEGRKFGMGLTMSILAMAFGIGFAVGITPDPLVVY